MKKPNLTVVLYISYAVAIIGTIAVAIFSVNRLRSEAPEIAQTELSPVVTSITVEEPDVSSDGLREPEEASEEVVEEIFVDREDVELLACAIYQESGGNAYCDDCRRRVADVILNRVEDERFPDTIEEVLTAPRQYGLFYKTGVVWPERSKADSEQEAVERAYRIAEEVLMGEHSDLYGLGYIWQAEFKQGTDIIYHCGNYFGK